MIKGNIVNFKQKGKKILIHGMCGLVIATSSVGATYFIMKDKFQRNLDSIREEILEVAKVATYEYNFTEILYYSDSNEICSVKVPFTTNCYFATIDGVAAIGVNTEDMELDPVSILGHIMSVNVTIPHSEILYLETDPNSLSKYVEKNGLLNPITADDLNGLLIDVDENQREKINSSQLLEDSDQRIQEIIKDEIHTLCGDRVSVNFVYK